MDKTPYILMCGKMEEMLKDIPDNFFDSIVTDPPYGLKFMGKKWDYQVPTVAQWSELLRVLKPGGYLLSFGGSRTFHRMAVNVEDAGFEIRDTIMWLYGSGFPKSMDISKAIDKAAGAEREVISEGKPVKRMIPGSDQDKTGSWIKDNDRVFVPTATAPATDLAKEWEGWGTALKPAHEPIIVARKPLIGTVAENVEAWGVGGINIDGCRVEGLVDNGRDFEKSPLLAGREGNKNVYGDATIRDYKPSDLGRFPANVIHDGSDEVINNFPTTKSGKPGTRRKAHETNATSGRLNMTGEVETGYGDEGNAARFFYCAKASKADRNEGVDMNIETEIGHNRFDTCETCGGTILQNPDRPSACTCDEPVRKNNVIKGNSHPTVKPTELMRYLVRLVTPKGGMVLDPFMGSGSTGKAAILEGFEFAGIDQDENCIPLATQRINASLV